MKKTLATLAIIGLVMSAVSAPGAANVPDTKGCPGFTQGNNVYWSHFWVLNLLLGAGIIPGQWIIGEGDCLPNS